MDDKTYVPADPDQVPCKEFYSSIPGVELDKSQTVKAVVKFGKKYLVWQAISANGLVSNPYIQEGTMNSEIYERECIKKRLIPFIRSLGHEISFFGPI